MILFLVLAAFTYFFGPLDTRECLLMASILALVNIGFWALGIKVKSRVVRRT